MAEILVIVATASTLAFMAGFALATHRHRASQRRKRELSFQLGNPVDLVASDPTPEDSVRLGGGA